jgi:fermentation-respiration switch protein FrsA (DUF1100 family)
MHEEPAEEKLDDLSEDDDFDGVEPDPSLPADELDGPELELEPPDGDSAAKPLRMALPALIAAAGLGAVELARRRFQHSQVFVPDRFPNGIWDPSGFGLAAEDVWFSSEDGTELHGWWMPHPRAAGALLYCHGNSGSLAHRVGYFLQLRRLKVHVFAFDYRGYGRSEGQPSEQGIYRDARSAYRHLTGPLGQDSERIILFGHSLGGAVAIETAQHCDIAGLVVQSSFTSIRDMAKEMRPGLPLHLITRNQFRSIEKVPRLSMPKLFIHGSADGTVPHHMGEELFTAAAEPKEWHTVPRAGHNDLFRRGGVRYLRRLVRFRKRVLGS